LPAVIEFDGFFHLAPAQVADNDQEKAPQQVGQQVENVFPARGNTQVENVHIDVCLALLRERAAKGADGITLLPFLNGERVPALPRASGSLLGLNTQNLTPANLCRAALEGTTFGLRHGLDLLRASGIRCDSIRLIGGGARSPLPGRLSTLPPAPEPASPRCLKAAGNAPGLGVQVCLSGQGVEGALAGDSERAAAHPQVQDRLKLVPVVQSGHAVGEHVDQGLSETDDFHHDVRLSPSMTMTECLPDRLAQAGQCYIYP
jgi:hypothetical protein